MWEVVIRRLAPNFGAPPPVRGHSSLFEREPGVASLYAPPSSYVLRVVFCPVWEGELVGVGKEGG